MEYLFLVLAILLYFPLISADKLCSMGTEEKAMLFKYSFFRSIIGIVVGGIGLLINGSSFHVDLYTLLTAIMFGIMLALCMLVTFYSMQVTTVAISSVFKAASVIIPCVFGAMFFNESITFINILGFLLFLLSVFVIVSKKKEDSKKFGLKAFLSCLGVLLTNGLGSVSIQLFGQCVNSGDEAMFMFISYCIQALILFVIYIVYSAKEKSQTKISHNMVLYGIIGTIAMFLIQQITAVLSSKVSSMSIFPVTMGSSVSISVLVGLLFFKEKTSFKSILGIIGVIISLVMINMF